MRRFITLFRLALGFGSVAHASQYDYRAGSMAAYNAASAERSFNSYIASGSHNFGTDPAKLRERMRQSFPTRSEPSRYSSPSLPSGYWNSYQAPAYHYTPPVFVDTRTPQQVLIDAAKAGNTTAMWNLAHNYIEGKRGFAQSADSGIFWLKTAFEHGNIKAGTRLFAYFDPDWFAGESTIKKDLIQSLYWLQKTAKAGDAEAMTILGGRTLQGAGVDRDPVEGVRLLKAAFQGGDKGALITLEAAYEWGWGVKKDLREALTWQREMAKRGMSGNPKVELIRLLVETDDPNHRVNTAEIQKLIESEPTHQEMQVLHARLADTDVLGPPDPAKCVALCQEIIANSDSPHGTIYTIRKARYLLAEHLYEGNGIRKNNAAAYHLYRAAAAVASTANPPSARNNFYFATLLSGGLSTFNADGTTTSIDEPKTALPLLFAAENSPELSNPLRAQAALLAARNLANHPELKNDFPAESVEGQLELAQRYDADTALGIALGTRLGWFGAADKDKSRALAKSVAESGDQPAAFWLARWTCEDSEGKDPNWQNDIETLLKKKNWDAHLWMCDVLGDGKYLPKDVKRTEALLRATATEGNNPEAQNRLGLSLWRGNFADKKVTEGVGWLEKSLQNGFWIAGRNLAKIYHLGLDVEKNETKARAFLEKAAEIGGAEAASVVVAAYEKGDIIDADPQAAAKWKATIQN